MTDQEKTKEQLLEELVEMRERLEELRCKADCTRAPDGRPQPEKGLASQAPGETQDSPVTGNTTDCMSTDGQLRKEIAEEKRIEEARQSQGELEKLIVLVFAEFVGLSPDETDAGIDYALEVIGEYSRADRSYLYVFSETFHDRNVAWEWCAPGITRRFRDVGGLGLNDSPWLADKIRRLDPIRVPTLADLPPEAAAERGLWLFQDTKSLVVVPLPAGRDFQGFIGLDSVVFERRWPESIVRLLEIVGHIVWAALDRKYREAALAKSEERYRRLVNQATDIIYRTDLKGRFTFCNPIADKIIGYSEEELIGRHFSELIGPDYREEVDKFYRMQLAKRIPNTYYEFPVLTKNGKERWIGQNVQLIGEGDRFVGFQAVARDVTDRKEAEEALRRSEERYALAQRAGNIGSWDWDIQSGSLTWSDTIESMFGFAQGEFGGTYEAFLQCVHPDDRQFVIDSVNACIDEGKDYAIEHRIVWPNGEVRWVSEKGEVYRDVTRMAIRMLGVVQDITTRKQAEEAVVSSRNWLEKIINTVADPIFVKNREHRWVLLNDAYCRFMGYDRDELLGKSDYDSLPKEEAEALWTKDEIVFTTGMEDTNEQKFTDGKGVVHTVVTKKTMYTDEKNEKYIVGVIRDITKRVTLEEQLRQAAKIEAIGHLAGGIAHDFNNLLTAMMGYSHMLLGELPEDSVQQKRLSQILLAAEKACELTRQLLAFSRKQILDIRVLDLNEVIENIEKILQRVIGEHIEFTTSLAADLGSAEADPTQIEQVLMNLAVNARDAMPSGGCLCIETRNVYLDEAYAQTHPEVVPGQYVMLAVTDTGTGMDADTKSRIFDPFFTTKEMGAGTGLGLSTVYGIVKQHRGHIAVYSEPGRGTTFKVYLPRIERPADHFEKTEVAWPDYRGRETVLLVEDEKVVRLMAAEVLEMLGYQVLEAGDPDEALKSVEQFEGPIHLLLTDVILPQMDGRSLYNRLSSLRPHMKVLYVSGYTENFIVHHGVLEKDVHFLSKPFTLDRLAAKVREVLDSPRKVTR